MIRPRPNELPFKLSKENKNLAVTFWGVQKNLAQNDYTFESICFSRKLVDYRRCCLEFSGNLLALSDTCMPFSTLLMHLHIQPSMHLQISLDFIWLINLVNLSYERKNLSIGFIWDSVGLCGDLLCTRLYNFVVYHLKVALSNWYIYWKLLPFDFVLVRFPNKS